MDYNTAMSQFEEDLELAVHSGNKERIEAIKCEINHLKKSRFDWFHNGFYDYKTGEWHTMKPDEAKYLANCGMSDEEIVEYVDSHKKYAIGSDAVKELYNDPVNHPSHYTQGGIECIDAIEAACTGLDGQEGYLVGQVIKYIWRWKHKNGLQDLEKAKWYLERLIANIGKTT